MAHFNSKEFTDLKFEVISKYILHNIKTFILKGQLNGCIIFSFCKCKKKLGISCLFLTNSFLTFAERDQLWNHCITIIVLQS